MGFKDMPNPGIELLDHMNVDYRISFLSPYLESHGILFKIPIKMRPLSTDGAIIIWVFLKNLLEKKVRKKRYLTHTNSFVGEVRSILACSGAQN